MKPRRTLSLLLALAFATAAAAARQPEPRIISSVRPLPIELDRSFQFRKVKLYFLGEQDLTTGKPTEQGSTDQTSQANGGKNKHKSTGAIQEASITFERQYRLFGAVTKLDQHQRFGNYFDFFWRIKRPADVTVRLEYRQEKLHEHTQAQEITYGNVRGTHKTEFKVIGDDYFDDGRVIAWRC